VGREKETFTLTDKPVHLCATAHDRTPYISNVGDQDIMLDTAPWPMTHGLVLRPGVTIPFVNPMPATDSTPIFGACPDGKGEVEILFLR